MRFGNRGLGIMPPPVGSFALRESTVRPRVAPLTFNTGERSMALNVRFPGPGNFNGSYDPRASDAQEGGQSTYNGSIAVSLLDRSLMQNALPDDFRLAHRRDGGRSTARKSMRPIHESIHFARDLARARLAA